MPATHMRAVVVSGYGGPEVLELVEQPVPSPGHGEVLVAVAASGLGAWDIKRRTGAFGTAALPGFVLGTEVAGRVVVLGEGVAGVAVGDRVFGYVPTGSGANAEYLVAPAQHLAAAPSALDDAHVAAAPVGGLTAHQALLETLALRSGETVLITGAAGGMGSAAAELATSRGFRVVATARAEDHAFVASLGVEASFNYQDDWVRAAGTHLPGGADALLDCVGGRTFTDALDLVRDSGRALTLVPMSLPESPPRGLTLHNFSTRPGRDGLQQLAAALDRGDLRVHLAATFGLDEAAAAHTHFEHEHPRGKLALVP